MRGKARTRVLPRRVIRRDMHAAGFGIDDQTRAGRYGEERRPRGHQHGQATGGGQDRDVRRRATIGGDDGGDPCGVEAKELGRQEVLAQHHRILRQHAAGERLLAGECAENVLLEIGEVGVPCGQALPATGGERADASRDGLHPRGAG